MAHFDLKYSDVRIRIFSARHIAYMLSAARYMLSPVRLSVRQTGVP